MIIKYRTLLDPDFGNIGPGTPSPRSFKSGIQPSYLVIYIIFTQILQSHHMWVALGHPSRLQHAKNTLKAQKIYKITKCVKNLDLSNIGPGIPAPMLVQPDLFALVDFLNYIQLGSTIVVVNLVVCCVSALQNSPFIINTSHKIIKKHKKIIKRKKKMLRLSSYSIKTEKNKKMK